MPWTLLIIAGFIEAGWAIGLKYTDGFKKPVATVVTIVLMIGSFYVLAQAVRTLPIGTAYAIWTGIGAFGTALLGMYLFKEPATLARMAFLALIIVGIVGSKFTAKT